MKTLAGVTDFTEQPGKRKDNAQGSFQVRIWKGDRDGLTAFLASGLPAGWIEREIDEEFVYATVTATYGIDPAGGTGSVIDPIARIWTLNGTEEQISLRDKPEVQKALQDLRNLSEDLVFAFWKQFKDELRKGTPPSQLPFADETLRALYSREAGGQTSMLYGRWVLVKNQTVISTSAIRASHENAGKLYTWPSLLASEPTLQSEAPLLDLQVLNSQPQFLPAGLFWYKHRPTVTPSGLGQYSIAQTYESFEDYDIWTYGNPL